MEKGTECWVPGRDKAGARKGHGRVRRGTGVTQSEGVVRQRISDLGVAS